MKKLLLFAATAIIFAGCQKELEQKTEGRSSVTVSIADQSFTKATTVDKTTETAITWSTASLSLTCDGGPKNGTLNNGGSYTFTDVTNPTKLSASINSGAASYTGLSTLKDLAPAAMHSYGETETFTPDGRFTHEGVDYNKYTAEVITAIPVSRIEIGGITFKNAGTQFSACTLSHVYVDGAPVSGVNVAYGNGSYSKVEGIAHADSWTNFAQKTDLSVNVTGGENFQSGTVTCPSGEQVYAFNVFGQGSNTAESTNPNKLPTIKLHFTGCSMTSGSCLTDQYAFIKEYQDAGGQSITAFEPGKIYQITGLTVEDKNLSPDPNGSIANAVVATVTVSEWTIVNTTGVLN